jgi:hypothetical protein
MAGDGIDEVNYFVNDLPAELMACAASIETVPISVLLFS